MYINTVDQADIVTGSIARHDALDAGVNFRVVHVFLFNEKGHLLIQQIPHDKRHPGYWGSSVAGYVYFDESYDAAALRRVSEELGINTSLVYRGKSEMREGKGIKFIALYTANWPPFICSAIRIDPTEISAIEFIHPQEIASEIQSGARQYTPTFVHIFQNMDWQGSG